MNEARKQLFSCIDYCGDVARGGNYSIHFSPNNIKTVVLSPDGMFVRLHIGVSVPSRSRCKGVNVINSIMHFVPINTVALYDRNKGTGYFETAKERSMLEMLVNPLVCGCVEEIIVIKGVSVPQYSTFMERYGAWEFNYNSLLSKASSNNLLDGIKKRFPRLKYITESSLPFNAFISSIQSLTEQASVIPVMTDLLKEDYVTNIIPVNDDCWMNGSKLQPSVYNLDKELASVFEKIKRGCVKQSGNNSKLKTKSSDLACFYHNMAMDIVKIPARAKSLQPYFLKTTLGSVPKLRLYNTGNFPKHLDKSPFITFLPATGMSDAVSVNINKSMQCIRKLYFEFISLILRMVYHSLTMGDNNSGLSSLYNCEYFFREGEGAPVVIPNELMYLVKDIQEIYPDFIINFSADNLVTSFLELEYFFINFNYSYDEVVMEKFLTGAIQDRLAKGVSGDVRMLLN